MKSSINLVHFSTFNLVHFVEMWYFFDLGTFCISGNTVLSRYMRREELLEAFAALLCVLPFICSFCCTTRHDRVSEVTKSAPFPVS